MIEITYTDARANLAKVLDRVTADREALIIKRRGKDGVAMISEEDLRSILETLHLLSSPKNEQRLLTAYNRAMSRTVEPQTVEDLAREVGLGRER